MKTWKLVSGILSIVLFLIVAFQSCAASFADALEDQGGTSGASGILVAIFMLAAGIVSICTRNAEGKAGSIATAILYILAALLGFSSAGAFADLKIWGGWCLICGIMAIISLFVKNKPKNVETEK